MEGPYGSYSSASRHDKDVRKKLLLQAKVANVWKHTLYQSGISTFSHLLALKPLLPSLLPPSFTTDIFLQAVAQVMAISDISVLDKNWWLWPTKELQWPQQKQVNVVYRYLQQDHHQQLTATINRKWSIQWTSQQWELFWKKITSSPFRLADSLWIWRMAHAVFYTGTWARRHRQQNTHCDFCTEPEETMSHLFRSCPRWHSLFSAMATAFPTLRPILFQAANPFTIFLQVLTSPTTLAAAYLLLQTWRYQWRLRCAFKYEGTLQQATMVEPLQRAIERLLVLAQNGQSHPLSSKIRLAVQLLSIHLPTSLQSKFHQPPFLVLPHT
ncbi:hypothetical protein R1sor_011132 [Riccia sorocarpa]|uniref:Reverse transcriptase zinc-binding domain-containing protein n=1 Tax=Riccia sorocarpa TaxID=122646 RepID=A0ABD3I186_9MARC